MSKVCYQGELSDMLRKQSSCTRLPTRSCRSEPRADSPGNAQVRNGHFLVSNFGTVKKACIQIPFCVSLNIAQTMSSNISAVQMDIFVLLDKRDNRHTSDVAGEMKSVCCALGASSYFRMGSSHQCHGELAHYVFSSYS